MGRWNDSRLCGWLNARKDGQRRGKGRPKSQFMSLDKKEKKKKEEKKKAQVLTLIATSIHACILCDPCAASGTDGWLFGVNVRESLQASWHHAMFLVNSSLCSNNRKNQERPSWKCRHRSSASSLVLDCRCRCMIMNELQHQETLYLFPVVGHWGRRN